MVAPTSPTCRSPLSQHSFRPESPGQIRGTDLIPASDSPARRQSIAPSPRRLSTSRSLVGSYTLSLLSSRMSAAHPTHHVPSAFTLKIGSISPHSAGTRRSALRCPEHVKIAFDARWYELEGAREAAAWTPWVGNVDVEGFYQRRRRAEVLEWARGQCEVAVEDDHAVSDAQATPDLDTYYERILKGWIPTPTDIHLAPPSDRTLLRRMRCPPKPGYELGVSGKLQFFIMQTLDQPATSAASPSSASPTATPVKVFLVDYDLNSLEPGGRLLYKERAYQTIPVDPQHASHSPSSPVTSLNLQSGKPKPREVLKYAFELHFLCSESTIWPLPAGQDADAATDPRPKRRSRSYYLGKQIRLVFPTSSGGLNTSDGPATTAAAQAVPKPSVRIERLIEVQNPSPLAPASSDAPREGEVQGTAGRCGSFTSESWQGLRGAWDGRGAVSPAKVDSESVVSPHGGRPASKQTPLKAPPIVEEVPLATIATSLTFARSPTPIQPLSLKSPSLLTARLEEMSGLSPQSYSPGFEREPAEEQPRIASPGAARKRTLWPDDTERLLSESLQKLHVSYR